MVLTQIVFDKHWDNHLRENNDILKWKQWQLS